MSTHPKITASDDAWDKGSLGRDEAFVSVAQNVDERSIDEAMELQLISIRLQKSLIDDLKLIAKLNGLGYQPLVRQVLKRFADCEKKRLLREIVSERAAAQISEAAEEIEHPEPKKRQRA